MHQMGHLLRAQRVSNAVAAGTTTVTSDLVDTAGAETVLFVVSFGAIVTGAATSIKAQQGVLANGADQADLAGTGVIVADTDDNRIVLLEIVQPAERFVRAVVTRATQNSAVDSILALLFKNRVSPTPVQHSSVQSYKYVLSPAEGTP